MDDHQDYDHDNAPRDMIAAASRIQHFYLLELNGKPLHPDFFTWERVKEYMKASIHSTTHDFIYWIIGYVFLGAIAYFLQENYFNAKTTELFFWKFRVSPIYWFTEFASFASMAANTFFAASMAPHYSGVIPKKAVRIVLGTRTIFLFNMALLIFAGLGFIWSFVLSDALVGRYVAFLVALLGEARGPRIYNFFVYLKRHIFESGIILFIAIFVSSVIPWVAIIIFKKKKKKQLGISPK
jgi:hypothetical protein